jgi:hypothetical protein
MTKLPKTDEEPFIVPGIPRRPSDSFYVGMKPWGPGHAGRDFEPLGADYTLDIHNNGYVEGIYIESKNKQPSLIFQFACQPYRRAEEPEETYHHFSIIFHDIEIIEISPEGFLPFRGMHIVDSFLPLYYDDHAKIWVRWDGLTESQEPDPAILFWASQMEYQEG